MVEKWLIKVEELMIQSLKDIITQSVASYGSTYRPDWILSWPGQVIQCVDCIQWTSEVHQAICNGTLAEQVEKCSEQIEDCVKLVRGKLDPGSQVTTEALIVIDVHGSIEKNFQLN